MNYTTNTATTNLSEITNYKVGEYSDSIKDKSIFNIQTKGIKIKDIVELKEFEKFLNKFGGGSSKILSNALSNPSAQNADEEILRHLFLNLYEFSNYYGTELEVKKASNPSWGKMPHILKLECEVNASKNAVDKLWSELYSTHDFESQKN